MDGREGAGADTARGSGLSVRPLCAACLPIAKRVVVLLLALGTYYLYRDTLPVDHAAAAVAAVLIWVPVALDG